MGMLSDAATASFRASVKLTAADITGYITAALQKRGFTDVKVQYNYKDANPSDRFATPTLTATISGKKDGSDKQETITDEQIKETVAAELRADGHTLYTDKYTDGLSIGYTSGGYDGGIYGNATFAIPRKR